MQEPYLVFPCQVSRHWLVIETGLLATYNQVLSYWIPSPLILKARIAHQLTEPLHPIPCPHLEWKLFSSTIRKGVFHFKLVWNVLVIWLSANSSGCHVNKRTCAYGDDASSRDVLTLSAVLNDKLEPVDHFPHIPFSTPSIMVLDQSLRMACWTKSKSANVRNGNQGGCGDGVSMTWQAGESLDGEWRSRYSTSCPL